MTGPVRGWSVFEKRSCLVKMKRRYRRFWQAEDGDADFYIPADLVHGVQKAAADTTRFAPEG